MIYEVKNWVNFLEIKKEKDDLLDYLDSFNEMLI